MTLADLIAQHTKECSSDHCAACDCGWDSDDFTHGPFAHADHLANVIEGSGLLSAGRVARADGASMVAAAVEQVLDALADPTDGPRAALHPQTASAIVWIRHAMQSVDLRFPPGTLTAGDADA